ncbi:hypothetical protein [uncultured Sphingomonas sp.]|uniref:hypothetical protein n=1 Tax=uncultured Sphingomonas sp. TaxID=158754 RepID=UPI0035CC788A
MAGSSGIFGEGNLKLTDALKINAGLHYDNDRKRVEARNTQVSFLTPFTSIDDFTSPFVGSFDPDPGIAGNQLVPGIRRAAAPTRSSSRISSTDRTARLLPTRGARPRSAAS